MEEDGSLTDNLYPSRSPSPFALASRRGSRDRLDVVDEEISVGPDSPKRGKLLLGVANVGGSLTVLLQIALVAWGVRQLRSLLARRRQRAEDARRAEEKPFRLVDPPFAMLSSAAVRKLVELDPLRYFLIDVRYPAAVNNHPAPFEAVLLIPELELEASLQLSEKEWETRFPSVQKPRVSDVLVFLSNKGSRSQRAAIVAAGLGYSGCCVLSGGIEAYEAALSNDVDVPLKFLSRDALATLLERHESYGASTGSRLRPVHLIDVRRCDERALFGHIKGSLNIPVDVFPKALTLDEESWEKAFHFPKFGEDDTIIFQCRTNGRASWAAQLAQDAGSRRCFVYKEGVYGWRLDPNVQPHEAFQFGSAPPDLVKFDVEVVDHEAAMEELQQLGLA